MRPIILIIFLLSCSHNNKTVIAHRGASGYLPEHTLSAAALAHGFNVDYVEADIVVTKDSIPIVLHDITLNSTTDVAKKFPDRKRVDGKHYAIDFTLNEIKQLRVSERIAGGSLRFANRFPFGYSNFTVPTLAEFIQLVEGLNKTRRKKIGIYPEIKNPRFHQRHQKDISQIVLAILSQLDPNTPLILQCFDFSEIKRLRIELGFQGDLIQLIGDNSWPDAPSDFSYLTSERGLAELSKHVDGLGVWIGHLKGTKGKYLVHLAKKHGLIIHGYTFRLDALPKGDSEVKLLDFLFEELEIDGLFADQPDIVMGYLNRN